MKRKTLMIDPDLHYELSLLKLQLEQKSLSDVIIFLLGEKYPRLKKGFQKKNRI